VEPTGLEPVTPCLQSKCATNCAMAPWSLLPLSDRPSRLRFAGLIGCQFPCMCALLCNEVRGTVHGLLSNRTDQMTVHTSLILGAHWQAGGTDRE
jgi:hypothetical protein